MTTLDLYKNNESTNTTGWIKDMNFISYGVVTAVVNRRVVEVTQVIRTSASTTVTRLPLIGQSSSLMEVYVQPQIGDLVLVLYLDKITRNIFENALERYKASGDKDWTIYEKGATGYNQYSGVALLLQSAKGFSPLSVNVMTDGEDPFVSVNSDMRSEAVFRKSLSLLFPSDEDSGEVVIKTGKDRILSLFARSEANFNFYAPLNINAGLDSEQDEDVESPITVTLESKSDFTFDTKSAVTATIEKSIELTTQDTATATIEKAIDITGNDTLSVTTKKEIVIKSDENITLEGKKLVFKSSSADLKSLFDKLLDTLIGAVTVGSPASHKFDFATDVKFQEIKQMISRLLE